MADFAPSLLEKGQAIFTDKFMSGEWRMPDVAAFQTAETAGVANPSLAGLRDREDRAVSAYFPIRQVATNGTGRVAKHTGASGDSLEVPITWTTFSEPFQITIEQGNNNVLDAAIQFAATMRNLGEAQDRLVEVKERMKG